jgi:hypothetical protein
MKRIVHIGEWNAHLLEPGDRLHFKASKDMTDSHGGFDIPWWEGPEEFNITVAGTFLHSIHGARIFSVEKIGPQEWDDWYLRDDWTITVIYPEEG